MQSIADHDAGGTQLLLLQRAEGSSGFHRGARVSGAAANIVTQRSFVRSRPYGVDTELVFFHLTHVAQPLAVDCCLRFRSKRF